MTKEDALSLVQEIKDNIHICCAITMEPDDVLVLLDKLEKYINEQPTIKAPLSN